MRTLKKLWTKYVTWPRMRRRLRDGVVAVQWLNQMMIKQRVPRQRRRHILRDIDRDPGQLLWVLDILYQSKGV